MMTAAALCLALNVYFESRGEVMAGQHAVAHVTMNRAERNEKTVCDTVFEHGQFSWTARIPKRGTPYQRAVLAQRKVDRKSKEWNLATAISKITLAGFTTDITGGATHYHAKSVRPQWRTHMTLVRVIGHHRFYRQA